MTFNSIDEALSRVAGDIPPIADQLEWKFPERWVRIHTLPDSKRYPENVDEIFEVLRRHNTLLTDIATAEESFWLITPHGSEKKDPTKIRLLNKRGSNLASGSLFPGANPTIALNTCLLIDQFGMKEN